MLADQLVLKRMALRLLNVNRFYGIIRWLTEEEAIKTISAFERRSHFNGKVVRMLFHSIKLWWSLDIIECIDDSHVQIVAPKQFPNLYFNRKKFHSVILQGVCNHAKLFIDIHAGEAGLDYYTILMCWTN